LVKDGKTGIIFKDSRDLANHIFDLFKNFPMETDKLNFMRENILEFQKYRWNDEWEKKAAPVFTK
jgi:hypothetical protein